MEPSSSGIDIMKRMTPDSIEAATKAWFGNLMQGLAIRHDIGGPDISRVSLEEYKRHLIQELKRCARAAIKAQELAVPSNELARYCALAAEELIRMRQIRAANKSGELPTEALRQLPVYPAFQDYFEEHPSLIYDELIAATQDLFNSGKEAGTDMISEPGHPTHPVSKTTREWIELQVLGLACADDAWGAQFGTVAKDVYIMDCALRIRENARRAIRIGDLHVPAEDVDKMCWVAACETYLLRSLQAARSSGELSSQAIQQMAIYGPYRDYFEKGAALAAMAKGLAADAGIPIRPPGSMN